MPQLPALLPNLIPNHSFPSPQLTRASFLLNTLSLSFSRPFLSLSRSLSLPSLLFPSPFHSRLMLTFWVHLKVVPSDSPSLAPSRQLPVNPFLPSSLFLLSSYDVNGLLPFHLFLKLSQSTYYVRAPTTQPGDFKVWSSITWAYDRNACSWALLQTYSLDTLRMLTCSLSDSDSHANLRATAVYHAAFLRGNGLLH